jgi:hypothetical protein
MDDLDKICGTNSVKRGKCMCRVTFLIGLKKFYFLDYTLFEVK